MISLEQLRQIRELVGTTVTQIRTLEQENSELQEKLSQYTGHIAELTQRNQELEEQQKLMETEVGKLLHELQGLTPPIAEEKVLAQPAEISPAASPEFLGRRGLDKPAEHGHELEALTAEKSRPDTPSSPFEAVEDHSLDLSLGLDGDSLLALEENASTEIPDENAEIF